MNLFFFALSNHFSHLPVCRAFKGCAMYSEAGEWNQRGHDLSVCKSSNVNIPESCHPPVSM